jgi:hypothetical protein
MPLSDRVHTAVRGAGSHVTRYDAGPLLDTGRRHKLEGHDEQVGAVSYPDGQLSPYM